MVYAVIGVAILFLTVKGYSGKKLSCYMSDTSDAYLFTFVRMLFCIAIGIVLVFVDKAQFFLRVEWSMLAICFLSGLSNAAFLVVWMLAVRRNSMVSVDVSTTMGSLIPSVLCLVLFDEEMSVLKLLGFAMIVFATVILAGRSKKSEGRGIVGALLLVFAAVCDGMSGFSQQLYKHCYTEAGVHTHGVYYPKTVFHFYTYVFAALILLFVLIVYKIMTAKKAGANGEVTKKSLLSALSPRALLHVSVMALCLFAANYLQTVATNDHGMSSQLMYPIIKGACLITVNFTAMIFFGEKITVRSVIGSLTALGGIVSMSFL